MEESIIISNSFCKECSKNEVEHYCSVSNKEICIQCCDKYQLCDSPIDECLSCVLLLRDLSYDIKFGSGIVYSHHHKNKYVFDNNFHNLLVKSIELYKRLGVDNIKQRYKLATQYHYADMNEEALIELEHIMNRPLSKEGKILVYEKHAEILQSLGRINESKRAYIKSIGYGNNTPKIHRRLGELYSNLKEYSQAIYQHNKALEAYFSFTWYDSKGPLGDNDSFYFTNYYSLASAYFTINDYQKSIENGTKFIDYYGGYHEIVQRYFSTIKIEGDSFIPQLIPSTYEILALSYKGLKFYDKAKEYVNKARIFEPNNVNIAKLEGVIEGILEVNNEVSMMREVLRKIELNNELLISIHSDKNGDYVMGNKYEIINEGKIKNLAIGDNVSIKFNDQVASEIKSILYKIENNLVDCETRKEVKKIITDIEKGKFKGLKQQLINLISGVSAGFIASKLPELFEKLIVIVTNM